MLAAMAQAGVEALVVHDQPENVVNQRLIVELVEKNRLPAIFPYREAVELGGFMAYVLDPLEIGRQIANQIAKILRGTNTRATSPTTSQRSSC